MRNPIEIDHIEPRWREGRDYQLVCGFETCSLNFCERAKEENVRKSNNFLPWRVCIDELGTVPVEHGDLCLFLDPDTNEWVLEEFLGTWWYEKSMRFGSRSQPKPSLQGRKHAPERIENMRIAQRKRFDEQPVTDETREKIKQAALTKKKPSKESRKRQGESLRGHKRSPETLKRMKLAALKRWQRKKIRSMSVSNYELPDFED
jgi:hypothetical protein